LVILKFPLTSTNKALHLALPYLVSVSSTLNTQCVNFPLLTRKPSQGVLSFALLFCWVHKIWRKDISKEGDKKLY